MADPEDDGDPPPALVDDLRRGAEPVARGRFRIDAAGAAARARHFLSSPHDWLLPLVAAAVVGRARFLRVRESWRGIEIRLDAPLPDADALRSLAAGIPAGGEPGERALRQLALALHVARTLAPAGLTLESAGARLDLASGAVGPAPPGDGAVLRFRHASVLPGLLRLLGRRSLAVKTLRRRAAFAPPRLEVSIDSRRINGPIDFGLCAAVGRLSGPGSEALPLAAPSAALVQRSAEAGFSALIGVSGSWYEQRWLSEQGAAVAFVQDGVSLTVEGGADVGYHNVRAIVCAPSVRFDASWTKPVQDESFGEVMRALRGTVDELLAATAERWQPGEASEAVWIHTHAVEEVERRLRRAGRLSEVLALQEKLVRQFDARMRASDDYGGNATRRLASLLARLGREQEARDHLARLRRLRRGEWRSVSQEDADSDLGALELDADRLDAAEELSHRALRRFRRGYSRKYEPIDRPLEYLGLRAEVRLARGEPCEPEMKLAARYLDASAPKYPDSMLACARFFVACEAPSQAAAWAERALQAESASLQNRAARGQALALSAAAAWQRGDAAGAREGAARARDALSAELDPEHPEMAGVLALLAIATDALGRDRDADTWVDAALAIVTDRFGPDHREATFLRELAAAFQARRGRPDDAEARLCALAEPVGLAARREWRAHLLGESGRGPEATALAAEALSEGQAFAPFRAVLTLSHGALWSSYELPGLRHRPVRLRLRVCEAAALARAAARAEGELRAAGRREDARRAEARRAWLERWRDAGSPG